LFIKRPCLKFSPKSTAFFDFFSFFVPPGCPVWIIPMLIGIELISYIFRAISISVRLFANIMAGHSLFKILAGFAWGMLSLGIVGYIGSFVIKYMIKEHHDEDLNEMVKKYKESVKAGHGVIAVTHSQGNLFAVESSDKIASNPQDKWMLKYFYHVSIASPATRFAFIYDREIKNHKLISNDNDPVAKNLGSLGTNVDNYARYFTYDYYFDASLGNNSFSFLGAYMKEVYCLRIE